MREQLIKLTGLLLTMVFVFSIVTSKIKASELDDLKEGITYVTEVTGDKLNKIKEAVKEEFSDYGINEWYADFVAKLVAVDGIVGYTDNTFKPNGTITKAEFTKILVASIYGIQEPTGEHWASGYICKAEEEGILLENEFPVLVYDKTISRQEMAKLIILTSEKALGEESATNLDAIATMVYDSDEISTDYKSHVLGAYSKGIISGYNDKTFKPLNTATRAEACTMLVKLLDSSIREVPGTADWETVIINGYVLPKDISVLDYSVSTKEEINLGYAEADIFVNLWSKSPLLDQWTATEQALESQFSADIVKEAMDYIKLKTVDTYVLEEKKIYVEDRYIWIKSNKYNSVISIQVCYK